MCCIEEETVAGKRGCGLINGLGLRKERIQNRKVVAGGGKDRGRWMRNALDVR